VEFHRQKGSQKLLPPSGELDRFPDLWVRGRRLDVFALYKSVQERGGFRAAPEAEQVRLHWGDIFADTDNYFFGNGPLPTTAYLVSAYQELLAQYEAAHMGDAKGADELNLHVTSTGENLPPPGTRVQVFYEPELNWFPATIGEREEPQGTGSLCWLYYDCGEAQLHRLSDVCLRYLPRLEDANQPEWNESHPAAQLVSETTRVAPASVDEAVEAMLGAKYSTRGKYYGGWRVAHHAHSAGLPDWLVSTLEAHEVDEQTLPLLTDEDLLDMGIESASVREKMLCSIQNSVAKQQQHQASDEQNINEEALPS
jgi:hypothetical protein